METNATLLKSRPFHVLIPAAGSGFRLGGDVPKQYRNLLGKSVLRRTIEVFLACPGLETLRVIIDPAHREMYDKTVQGLNLPPFVAGGKDRRESVCNGLKALDTKDDELVLIHDAARPFITVEDIVRMVGVLGEARAATLAVPVADTLRREDGRYVDRDGLWAVQTPQGFHYGVICQAHEECPVNKNYTDDTAMVAALGHEVKLVQGSRSNYKITTADDMELAQRLMSTDMETRTGSGFDVHAFADMQEGSSVRLCGIDISHDRPLAGHSDADVGLHALTDALLGAIGAGDIGAHFPPSNPQWKGVDSSVFVGKAVELLQEHGGRIINLDVTLVCEAPKIGPHREAMRARIAEICTIDMNRVSVKATTTERLGFTGRGEGIAAQAVVSVQIPDKEN